jgi:hypothetical protein
MKLVLSLFEQNGSEANAYIAQEKQYTHSKAFDEDLNKVEQIVSAVVALQQGFEASLEKKIGKETVIRYRGNDWPVIIRAIDNGNLKVDLKSVVGSSTVLRPGTIPLTDIDPLERIRAIGQPDTEPKCAAICLIALKIKDYKLAVKAAEKAGPFADVLKALVESKQPSAPQ